MCSFTQKRKGDSPSEGRKGKREFYANGQWGTKREKGVLRQVGRVGRRRPAAAVVRGPGPLPGRPTGPAGLGPRAPGVLQTDWIKQKKP